MAWLEKEQIDAAKAVDLFTYLQENEPHELRKTKNANEYRTATHSSLVISNGRWFWNRGGFGGRSAVDYLIKVRGMDFLEAVNMVLDSRSVYSSHGSIGDGGSSVAGGAGKDSRSDAVTEPAGSIGSADSFGSASAVAPRNTPLSLPLLATLPANAVAYLQKRGISPEVIGRCLELGILGESRKNKNVIFIGKDEDGKARFACQRGIRDDFKADVFGSDKRFSFSLSAENLNSQHLVVFESPIDLLSHATLQQHGCLADVDVGVEDFGDSYGFVSVDGFGAACDLDSADVHRLSLGGTSDVALIAYLERNPSIKQITFCLDNDEAGRTAVDKITEKLSADRRFEYIWVENRPPQGGAKDYNAALLQVIAARRMQKQQKHQHHKDQQPSRQTVSAR